MSKHVNGSDGLVYLLTPMDRAMLLTTDQTYRIACGV